MIVYFSFLFLLKTFHLMDPVSISAKRFGNGLCSFRCWASFKRFSEEEIRIL